MVYTFRKQNLTLPVQGMQLITCYEWVDAVPHGEGVWLTGGVGPMWRDHQLPRDKAASDRARSICHAVLGATIGAQTKRAKLNFLQEPSVWSMQQGGKKIVTEKKVGGPSVVVIVRSCCSSSAPNIMTLTNFRSFHKRSIGLEMRLQAENIISPILNCHAAAVAEAEKPGWQGSIATRKVFARPESFCAYKRKNL